MKAFISYSTKDKKFGASVKFVFDEMGVESFLAHDDIHLSEKWKTRILSELKSCKIFVPLLSNAFKKSEWCSQETGVIVNRRGVLVIPLSLDKTKPYGFISHIQGYRVLDGKIDRDILFVAVGKKWPAVIVNALLQPMEKVYSFRQAEAVVAPLVPHFKHFTHEQSNKFAELAVKNGQIWDASLCQSEYLPDFLRINKDKIKKTLYRSLKYQIKNRAWYERKST